jgi:multiple antibiotic resistance protein
MTHATEILTTLNGSFLTLFWIANPIGSALIFERAASSLSPCDLRKVARHIAAIAGTILVTSIIMGSLILDAFGISLAALRVAGGLVLGRHAWSLIAADQSSSEAAPRLTAGILIPLTVPLTIGPGTIAAAITIGAPDKPILSSLPQLSAVIIAAIMLALLIDLTYSHARRIARSLGSNGAVAATSFSAFLLLCIAAQMVLRGLHDALLI